jgi:uncharacterized RmlC-like cupin family protein
MGKQGLPYFREISATSVGVQGLCMHLLAIPPGGRGKAHLHANHETAIYILSGETEMWYGERLQQHLVVHTGDLLYIPANRSDAEPCTAVVARTDPNEQESVLVLPACDEEAVS